ncbi:MAG: hypothetical protein ACLP52_26425 [Streptosporangiaceae bacterium]|jgi:hypothetical protein
MIRRSAQELQERAAAAAAVRAKLQDPDRPQLSLDEVLAAVPADVSRAMRQEQLRDLGFGAKQARR